MKNSQVWPNLPSLLPILYEKELYTHLEKEEEGQE